MPCRDFYDYHPDQYFRDVTEPALKKQISFAESALCLTLNTLEQLLNGIKQDFDSNAKTNPLDILDFEEAGITRKELEQWWKRHKKLDEKHREEEKLKQIKDAALSKLNDEEIKVLGIKQ